MNRPDDPGPIVVVKVGGSLLEWPVLPSRLAEFLDSPRLAEDGPPRLVLIAGGGAAADVVRALDAAHGLGEVTSHYLALRAMDLTAQLLGGFVANGVVVEDLECLERAWRNGRRPILATRRFLVEVDERGDDPLPRSWQTTSDSIAARVASRVGAGRLILLKSSTSSATTRREAAAEGFVDPVFPQAAAGLCRIEFATLRDVGWELRPLAP